VTVSERVLNRSVRVTECYLNISVTDTERVLIQVRQILRGFEIKCDT
jgi:hypothetical protein